MSVEERFGRNIREAYRGGTADEEERSLGLSSVLDPFAVQLLLLGGRGNRRT
jgi:hypothetical protein